MNKYANKSFSNIIQKCYGIELTYFYKQGIQSEWWV